MKYLKTYEKNSEDTNVYNDLVNAIVTRFKSYHTDELKIYYSSKECDSNQEFDLDEIKLKNYKWTIVYKNNKTGELYLNWDPVDRYEIWELLDVLRYFEMVPEEVIDNQIADSEAEKFNM